MSFSELLKQCRKKQGVSQAELAARLGVTQQAVGKWESGKSSPDPSTVARIAELLNTTADYLLGLYRPVSNVSAPEERFFGSYTESLIPVIGTVNRGLGWLTGGMTAMLDLYLVLCVVWGLVVITGGNLNVLNDTVMRSSLYYKAFNMFNPFL